MRREPLADLSVSTSLDNSKVDIELAKLRRKLEGLDTAKAQADWQQGWIRRAEAVNRAVMKIGTSGMRMGGIGTGIMQGIGQQMFHTMTNSLQRAVGSGMDLVGKSVSDALDAQTVQRKFDNVFQGIERRSEEFAKSLGKSLGRSPTELKRAMSRFQDSLVPAGFDRNKAAEMSNTLTKLAVDLAASESISIGEAGDRLMSGLVGNHEALRLFGVLITDTSLNLQLMKDGIDGGMKKATEMQKMMSRLNMVMAGTRDAQGTAGRTKGSAAFEISAMNSALTALSETVGKAVVPSLGKLAEYVGDTAKQMTRAFGDPEKFGKSMAKWTEDMLGKFDTLRDSAANWMSGMVKEWPKVEDFIGKHIAQLQDMSKYWDAILEKLSQYRNTPADAAGDVGGAIFRQSARTSFDSSMSVVGQALGGDNVKQVDSFMSRLAGSKENVTGKARDEDINRQNVPGLRAMAYAITDGMHSALQMFTGTDAGSNAAAEQAKSSLGLDIKLPTWNDAAKQFSGAAEKLSDAGDSLKNSVLTFLEDHKTSSGLEQTNKRRQDRARRERRAAEAEANGRIDMSTVGGLDGAGSMGNLPTGGRAETRNEYRRRENARKLQEQRQARQDELEADKREKIDAKTGGLATIANDAGKWLAGAMTDPKGAIAGAIVAAKEARDNAIASMQQSPRSKSGVDWASLTGIQDRLQSQMGGADKQNENKVLFTELKTFLGVDWLAKLAKEIEKLNAGGTLA